MSNIQIIEAESKQQQKLFISFPTWLYESNKFYTPLQTIDEIADFAPQNTVNKGIRSKTLLAVTEDAMMPNYKTVVGRIAVFADEKTKQARFSHIDFIDNHKVAEKLFDAAMEFAISYDAKHLRGPLSFHTECFQGLLINGYDTQIAPPYNYAYYKNHMEEYGFLKDILLEPKDANRRIYVKATNKLV